MNTTTAAAQDSRIAELEQLLRLSDEGVSRLAQRCLTLEQELQAYLAANPAKQGHASPALLSPKLFYDAGFGLSEQDSLAAPEGVYDERTHQVTTVFELPVRATLLRLDPGEVPCCIGGLTVSDDRLTPRAVNGIALPQDQLLFLRCDPNLYLDGLAEYPAGLKLVVSYQYYPLEELAGEPAFDAVLAGLEQLHRQQLEARPRMDALEARCAGLEAQLAAQQASSQNYAATLERMQASTSWRLTAPLRGLAGLFHRR